MCTPFISCFFFFNATATTEIYTLSLHDALPIYVATGPPVVTRTDEAGGYTETLTTSATPAVSSGRPTGGESIANRSEEHTSELQSRRDLVCRLLLEKKKKNEYDMARHNSQYSHA